MKSLYKMTDEEVIGMVMGNSNISFALNNKSGSFNLQGCVNLAKEEIEPGQEPRGRAAVRSLHLAAQSLGPGTMLKRR